MLSPLAKKLQVKQGQKILLLNAPDYYQILLHPIPENTRISTEFEDNYDHLQLFVKSSSELANALKKNYKLLLSSNVIWIMYPKKSSGIQSDLDMMSSLGETEKYGLRPVASAAIDQTWTALRLKPIDQVKKSGIGNADIPASGMGKYINVEQRIIILPPDLKSQLEQDPSSLAFFETLSWTNKKEYVSWILTAKQEKTRIARIEKAAEMLSATKMNPTAK